MFDGEDDIPEYKVNDETLPKIRVFRESLAIKWIRSVLSELPFHLYFIHDHSGVKCILDKKLYFSRTDFGESSSSTNN